MLSVATMTRKKMIKMIMSCAVRRKVRLRERKKRRNPRKVRWKHVQCQQHLTSLCGKSAFCQPNQHACLVVILAPNIPSLKLQLPSTFLPFYVPTFFWGRWASYTNAKAAAAAGAGTTRQQVPTTAAELKAFVATIIW